MRLLYLLMLALAYSASASAQSRQIGDWELIRDVDAITDAVTMVGRSRLSGSARVLMMCIRGEPSVAVGHPAVAGTSGETQVSIRLDSRPAGGPYTATLTPARTASRLSSDISGYIIREGRTAQRLTVRVSGPGAPANLTAAFSLTGFASVANALNCSGMTLPPPPPSSGAAQAQPEIIGGIAALQRRIVYPDFDRRAGTQGTVYVSFVVDEIGLPIDIRVVRSVSPGLDAAAVQAVRLTQFTPGREAGRPVRVLMTLPVAFRIEEPLPAPSSVRP